jgi:hypothetical protein
LFCRQKKFAACRFDALKNGLEPVKWRDNRLFGFGLGHPAWGVFPVCFRERFWRDFQTVVAEMATEKVAENCLILELGFSLRATEFASEGRRTARFRAWS